jgi:serine/threonine-protein kinase RsbW
MWNRCQEERVVDIWWSLHLRREPASVPLARRILLGTMASAGVDPDISHEVGVALTEACANAVEHAAPSSGPGADSGFQVTATIEDGRLRVEVTDSAPGFSAAPVRAAGARRRRGTVVHGIPADAGTHLPDPCAEHGRGLFLIRALVDHVQFRNHPRSGAVVSFDKMLKYRDRPLLHAS